MNTASFLTFEEARGFALKLNLKCRLDWVAYSKSGNRPSNIPGRPDMHYKNKGWVSWGDWLGTKVVSCRKKKFMPFKEAKGLVLSLKLKSYREWEDYLQEHAEMQLPAYPEQIYKDKGWTSWGDWLGTGIISNCEKSKKFLSFEKAREFIRNLEFKNPAEWNMYADSDNFPNYIPKSPELTYINKGWISMKDWLGVEEYTYGSKFLSYAEANEIVKNLKLKTWQEWWNYCKTGNIPSNIPKCPEHVYENSGWIGIKEWLGYERPVKPKKPKTHKRKMIGTSMEEIRFYLFMQNIFPDTIHRHQFQYDKYAGGSFPIEIDIFVPHINFGIEYDGAFYHSSEGKIKRDKNKNEQLKNKGVTLFRIREKGLPALSKNEIIHDYAIDEDYIRCYIGILAFIKNNFKLTEEEDNKIKNIDLKNCVTEEDIIKLYSHYKEKDSIQQRSTELAEEWNFNRNNGITPNMVSAGSDAEFWWCCKHEHEWIATPHERDRGWGSCPVCKTIKYTHPKVYEKLMRIFHLELNGERKLENYRVGSEKLLWWVCPKGHSFESPLHWMYRTKSSGCPYCHGKKLCEEHSLFGEYPDIAKEWHPTKNGVVTTKGIFSCSHDKYFWVCKHGHTYEMSAFARTQHRQGCPYCAGKKVAPENSLAVKNPELSKCWHPTKNGDLTPEKITYKSGKKVYFQCPDCGHEWQNCPNNLKPGTENYCPNCKNCKKVQT